MTPEQVAQAWAKAEVARAHAPEVGEFWDAQARNVGVHPEQGRAKWWREHAPGRGLGVEGAAAVAGTARDQAQELEEAADRERHAGRADDRDRHVADTAAGREPAGSPERQEAGAAGSQAEVDAEAHYDRADALDDRAADLDGAAARHEPTVDTERAGGRGAPASPGVWQDGHPAARLAGQAYSVAPGTGPHPPAAAAGAPGEAWPPPRSASTGSIADGDRRHLGDRSALHCRAQISGPATLRGWTGRPFWGHWWDLPSGRGARSPPRCSPRVVILLLVG